MSLADKIKHQFDDGVKARGLSYFQDKNVAALKGGAHSAFAIVLGSTEYEVSLCLQERVLEASCSCPFIHSFDKPCKHLWAVVLACDAKNLLLLHAKHAFLRLRHESTYVDDLYSDRDSGDNEGSIFDVIPRLAPRSDSKGASAFTTPIGSSFRSGHRAPDPNEPAWKNQLNLLERLAKAGALNRWPEHIELIYVLDLETPQGQDVLPLEIRHRERKKDGTWGKVRLSGAPLEKWRDAPELDRNIMAILTGTQMGDYFKEPLAHNQIHTLQLSMLLPMLCATGRFYLQGDYDEPLEEPITFDEGAPWKLQLEVVREQKSKHWVTTGALIRGDECMSLSEPMRLFEEGWLFTSTRVARLESFDAFHWIHSLRTLGPLSVPATQKHRLLEMIASCPRWPLVKAVDLPIKSCPEPPKPLLKLDKPTDSTGETVLKGHIEFLYGETLISSTQRGSAHYDRAADCIMRRDQKAEAKAKARLLDLGFQARPLHEDEGPAPLLAASKLPLVAETLLSEGWRVEAQGALYRAGGAFAIKVVSGVDWFEVQGGATFDDQEVSFPSLLKAIQSGQKTVTLGDGSLGVLPSDWLQKHGVLLGMGQSKKGSLLFQKSQIGFLDALLATQPKATFDKEFENARRKLREFDSIKPKNPPKSFQGALRPYQRDGLGWFQFLDTFGFGGCLADDMGLGKTVQVLALLAGRVDLDQDQGNGNGKKIKKKRAPSLIVVPKSLLFNWAKEASRFAPHLKVLTYAGSNRSTTRDSFSQQNLIITTYGHMRSDIDWLKDFAFDYVVLDEAQAIKNASTGSAKAARLLNGSHRLALSGTPIENHLGELWSLFEFLNPGLLGKASAFNKVTDKATGPDEEGRQHLARALRPFILRRTKDQVAKDLPEKTEQTLFCELEGTQRKHYDQLRNHYRALLQDKTRGDGLKKNKIQILEALLRLRQCACHPGLIDKELSNKRSAKLDLLLARLEETFEDGKKALVFSQFTSLLAIVRTGLDARNLPYEYLDGRTRDRQAKVDAFQNDSSKKLFLISLKAGGLGLNLTAAEYVFLLDPWWNPAVEAQAVDRAHRIGQTRHVFAYRLIAKDTVEERVLELQEKKRNLADAIISADNSLIRDLTREDLAVLLS